MERAVSLLAVYTRLANPAAVQSVTIPFEFAASRRSLLFRARIDRRAALLLLDTGSSHTILLPSAAGVSPSELASPRTGGGVIGDALVREVRLEVGPLVWQRRLVSVMDLSAVLGAYSEKIDGLLGMDFLFEFSEATIDFKRHRITLTT